MVLKMHFAGTSMTQPLRKCADWDTTALRDPVEKDRRRRSRMQVHWPVIFSDGATNGALESVTHDLSSGGFYCVASAALIPGEMRTCMLAIPAHHRNSGDHMVQVYCKVRVIRVEALAESGMYGIGCRIEDYRFLTLGLAAVATANHFGERAVIGLDLG